MDSGNQHPFLLLHDANQLNKVASRHPENSYARSIIRACFWKKYDNVDYNAKKERRGLHY